MNELPDSMMATTLFVGNLNEFVKDEDLSDLFQVVSSLQTVPACVVRKPDMSSLEYGFVSFPSVEEKEVGENALLTKFQFVFSTTIISNDPLFASWYDPRRTKAAIVRFHATEFRGRRLKVEAIKDTPGIRRVRIPEKMIAYVSGTKKSVGSTSNTIHKHSLRRVSRDDVDRMSRAQPSKRKGSRGGTKPRLSDEERAELERAARKGFVTISGAGSKRTRPLTQMHRSWCDARGKPQICVHKATGGSRPIDQVAVDLSPLRFYGLFDSAFEAEDHTVRWKFEILTAASAHGMQLCGQVDEFDDEECVVDEISDPMENVTVKWDKVTRESWATKPIGNLPVLSLMFQGERSNAKSMAKALAVLWDIPEKDTLISDGDKKKSKKDSKSKMEGLRQHRKRGGGHRQVWD